MFKTWGWESSRLCAYKDDQLQPASISRMPTRLDWVDAPRCSAAPAASNSARDKLNRLWGWERHRWVGKGMLGAWAWQAGSEASRLAWCEEDGAVWRTKPRGCIAAHAGA
jgi:hypothetical protein